MSGRGWGRVYSQIPPLNLPIEVLDIIPLDGRFLEYFNGSFIAQSPGFHYQQSISIGNIIEKVMKHRHDRYDKINNSNYTMGLLLNHQFSCFKMFGIVCLTSGIGLLQYLPFMWREVGTHWQPHSMQTL